MLEWYVLQPGVRPSICQRSVIYVSVERQWLKAQCSI